jgi:dihydrolipoamide dehydrogenase
VANEQFDVIVVGGGPGGYVAAIRAAQLGLRTACIDATVNARGKPSFGGTCLNVGCIPSKALLDSSHHLEFIREHAGAHGINVGEVSIDLETLLARKDRVVGVLTQGVAGLLKKAGVTALNGRGRLLGQRRIGFQPADGTEERILSATSIVLATGSVPASLPFAPVDGVRVVDSTGALSFPEVPARLGVLGAGVIGLELGSVWRRLGAEVTLIEAMDRFLPLVDQTIAAEALKTYRAQGLDIRLGTRASAVRTGTDAVEVDVTDAEGKASTLTFDKLVVAVGRRPNTEGLNLDAEGLTTDARGFIEVDPDCRTRADGIWALGDVVRGPMLAHKAMEEGVAVAERLVGQRPEVDFHHIPWVIYTWPEVAWVGSTEEELQASGADYRVGTFPFMASGRARAMGETAGMVKMLASSKDDRLLGVHIIGPNASELIGEGVLGLSFGASTEDLARTAHAHPTLAEAVHEAALAVAERTLHI